MAGVVCVSHALRCNRSLTLPCLVARIMRPQERLPPRAGGHASPGPLLPLPLALPLSEACPGLRELALVEGSPQPVVGCDGVAEGGARSGQRSNLPVLEVAAHCSKRVRLQAVQRGGVLHPGGWCVGWLTLLGCRPAAAAAGGECRESSRCSDV